MSQITELARDLLCTSTDISMRDKKAISFSPLMTHSDLIHNWETTQKVNESLLKTMSLLIIHVEETEAQNVVLREVYEECKKLVASLKR